jgi:hypothetical protein
MCTSEIDDMSERDKLGRWQGKPKHERKVRYISMRVREEDYERIMALFGDNAGVREFLINYVRKHHERST